MTLPHIFHMNLDTYDPSPGKKRSLDGEKKKKKKLDQLEKTLENYASGKPAVAVAGFTEVVSTDPAAGKKNIEALARALGMTGPAVWFIDVGAPTKNASREFVAICADLARVTVRSVAQRYPGRLEPPEAGKRWVAPGRGLRRSARLDEQRPDAWEPREFAETPPSDIMVRRSDVAMDHNVLKHRWIASVEIALESVPHRSYRIGFLHNRYSAIGVRREFMSRIPEFLGSQDLKTRYVIVGQGDAVQEITKEKLPSLDVLGGDFNQNPTDAPPEPDPDSPLFVLHTGNATTSRLPTVLLAKHYKPVLDEIGNGQNDLATREPQSPLFPDASPNPSNDVQKFLEEYDPALKWQEWTVKDFQDALKWVNQHMQPRSIFDWFIGDKQLLAQMTIATTGGSPAPGGDTGSDHLGVGLVPRGGS